MKSFNYLGRYLFLEGKLREPHIFQAYYTSEVTYPIFCEWLCNTIFQKSFMDWPWRFSCSDQKFRLHLHSTNTQHQLSAHPLCWWFSIDTYTNQISHAIPPIQPQISPGMGNAHPKILRLPLPRCPHTRRIRRGGWWTSIQMSHMDMGIGRSVQTKGISTRG